MLLNCEWQPSRGPQPLAFMGGLDHPLHLRSLTYPSQVKCQVFNRGEERFHERDMPCPQERVACVELHQNGYLSVKIYGDEGKILECYLPPHVMWEISLWSPEGKLVRTVTRDDFPPPGTEGKVTKGLLRMALNGLESALRRWRQKPA